MILLAPACLMQHKEQNLSIMRLAMSPMYRPAVNFSNCCSPELQESASSCLSSSRTGSSVACMQPTNSVTHVCECNTCRQSPFCACVLSVSCIADSQPCAKISQALSSKQTIIEPSETHRPKQHSTHSRARWGCRGTPPRGILCTTPSGNAALVYYWLLYTIAIHNFTLKGFATWQKRACFS